jgi:hypothetical protein
MKKYQFILTFLVILFYLIGSYFSYSFLRKNIEIKLSDINLTVVNIKKRVSINSKNIYSSTFKLWDLDISKILEERKKELVKQQLSSSDTLALSEKELLSNINSTRRRICLEKECWEFMGIVTVGNRTKVTLLSTDKKPKLKTFSVGDELLEGLTISKLTGDNMIIIHKKDKKKFVLKLFEVNASAYFPKVKKAINE